MFPLKLRYFGGIPHSWTSQTLASRGCEDGITLGKRTALEKPFVKSMRKKTSLFAHVGPRRQVTKLVAVYFETQQHFKVLDHHHIRIISLGDVNETIIGEEPNSKDNQPTKDSKVCGEAGTQPALRLPPLREGRHNKLFGAAISLRMEGESGMRQGDGILFSDGGRDGTLENQF